MLKHFTIKKLLLSSCLFAFAAMFLIQAVAATALFFVPAPAQAKAYPALNLQVPIPTFNGKEVTLKTNIAFNNSTAPIAEYIMLIYTYAVSAVGIVAAVVLMIGGLMWITAGGNASSVTEAKSMITASLTGLVLVLTSYFILNQINPALVNLQADTIVPPNIKEAASSVSITCDWLGLKTGGAIVDTCSTHGQAASASDSACTNTKPTPTDNFTAYTCCCSYSKDAQSNCYWSKGIQTEGVVVSNDGADYCKPSESFLSGDDAVKKCGSSDFPAITGENTNYTNWCCCPTANSTCADCGTLQSGGLTPSNACSLPDNQCQANKDLMNKLSAFSNDFKVTGAWPPTPGIHVEGSCHDTGICVDITPSYSDVTSLNKLAKELSNAGLGYMQFECNTTSCCSSYQSGNFLGYDLSGIPCKVNGTGIHFHVQMP